MLTEIGRRLLMYFRGRRFDADLDEEMRLHRELREQEEIERGLSAKEAHYAAQRRFGNDLVLREESRDMWGWNWLENLLQDVRHGTRMLLKNPGFTAVAVVTLALGIGVNTAIFSVVNAVILRPPPFPNSEQLVTLFERDREKGYDQNAPAAANLLDWRAQNNVFSQMAAYGGGQCNLTGDQRPERVAGAAVTANLFPLLGIAPLMGRTFTTEEEQPGHDRVVILSYALWQERFGGKPQILGESITVNGRACTVIGVMPPDFVFPGDTGTVLQVHTSPPARLWVPLALDPETWAVRSDHYLSVIARLKQNVTIQQATSEMDTIEQRLVKQYPNEFIGSEVLLVPLSTQIASGLEPVLLVLLGAVAFVLLIGCANVANLLLARAASRKKEIAVRTALGASRLRVIRQLFVESLLLGISGGALGVLLAGLGLKVLKVVVPENFPRVEYIGIDGWVLGFTTVVAFVTAVIFGLAPALQTSKTDLTESLKEASRGSAEGLGHSRLRGLLVVSEVAMSLVLLAGAGLMVRSFLRLENTSLGFNPDHVLTMELSLPESKYREGEQRKVTVQQIIDRLDVLPGVKSAAVTTLLPLAGGNFNSAIEIEGEEIQVSGHYPTTEVRAVTPEYFKTMGVPLEQGRLITSQDTNTFPPVLLINQTLARRWLPHEDPIGRHATLGWNGFAGEIVGVVGDTKEFGVDAEAREEVYIPYPQAPFRPELALSLRTISDPTQLANAARGAILDADPDLPISNVRTMGQVVSGSISQPRFRTILLGLFAGLALALAGIGIYSVISYSVAGRTHEIGLRMAIGAGQSDVLKLVLKQSLALILAGTVSGFALAYILTRLVASWLYQTRSNDPVTFVGVTLLLLVVGLLATYIPARRATKVDPMVALRYE
jgi:putative ABC transport system permease protein